MISHAIASMDRIDLQALNLAGPTQNQPVLSLLAVHHLDNRLFMSPDSHMKIGTLSKHSLNLFSININITFKKNLLKWVGKCKSSVGLQAAIVF